MYYRPDELEGKEEWLQTREGNAKEVGGEKEREWEQIMGMGWV